MFIATRLWRVFRVHCLPFLAAIMAKRKVIADDDDDEALDTLSQHSKRVRTIDSDDEVVVDRSRYRNRKPGNDKARQEDSDEDGEDEEDEEDLTQEEHNEEEEQRFEELNGEAIRQRLEQKRNTFGVSRMSATSTDGSTLSMYYRVLQSMESSSPSRCTISCATNDLLSRLDLRLISLSVSVTSSTSIRC
jgi:hypothetical protein